MYRISEDNIYSLILCCSEHAESTVKNEQYLKHQHQKRCDDFLAMWALQLDWSSCKRLSVSYHNFAGITWSVFALVSVIRVLSCFGVIGSGRPYTLSLTNAQKKNVSWVCSGWWVGTTYGEVQSSKKSLRSASAVGPALLVNKIWNILLQL